MLTPSTVQNALHTSWIGRTYLYLPETGSTNSLLKEQASAADAASPPHGTILLTDYQKRGRGRLKRRWEAPAGSSLLFSLLLRPDWPAERMVWLTMIAGLAVTEAVKNVTALDARLKWPNDGVVRQKDAWRKYCGILLEGRVSPNGRLQSAVVGIGINVNIPEDQLPPASFTPTSLMVAAGRKLSRLDLLAAILLHLEDQYDKAAGGLSPHAAWQEQLVFVGERVVVSLASAETDLSGTAVGTDPTGRLVIKDDAGVMHTIAAGDVSLRPL